MILAIFLVFYCYTISAETDLSILTTDQSQIWLNAVSQVNNKTQDPRIEIVRFDNDIDISLYNDQNGIPYKNRHLFKQNINKRVECYLYENQMNSSSSSNIYDQCHGALSSRKASQNIAGTYLYTGNQTSYDLGIILVEITNSFDWFNDTKSYLFNKQSSLRNGTELSLGFKSMIYYNSDSDLISLNKKINDIIQQANLSIKFDQENNLDTFISMEDLSCQRHELIIYDSLRLLIIVCTTKVTFKCPLQIGSTCWIEDKRMSNIQLNIDSYTFISEKTLTVRIDV
jgi:hypothetical protein